MNTPNHLKTRYPIAQLFSDRPAKSGVLCIAVIVAAIIFFSAHSARADDRFWNSAAGGQFGNAALWNPTQVPGINDVAIFALSNTYTVGFGFSPVNQRLLVRSGIVTFDLGGQAYTLTQIGGFDPSIVIGQNSGNVADLRILNGTLTGQTAMIGQISGSQGMARVMGANAVWNNASLLYVGAGGQGSLIVSSAGSVTSSSGFVGNATSAVGTATIAGAGSSWTGMSAFAVGNNGQGTFNIQSGGQLSNTTGYIGRFGTSTGTANVTGANSFWNNSGNLYVGGDANNAGGTGTLNVSNGGAVNVGGTLQIWKDQGSVVLNGGSITVGSFDNRGDFDSLQNELQFNDGTLTVNGGTFSPHAQLFSYRIDGATAGDLPKLVLAGGASTQNIGGLFVGVQRQAAVEVLSGSTLTTAGARFGEQASSVGSILVSGPGSTWTNSNVLGLGEAGYGTLTIQNGGVVSGTFTSLGGTGTGVGMATVSGTDSQWNQSSNLTIGGNGNGILLIEDGGKVSNNIGSIGFHASAIGGATVTGNGSTWTNSSELIVGYEGSGTLFIADGGQVSNTSAFIGEFSGSTGEVTVTGSGSTWTNSGGLGVGTAGSGTLTIADGGHVSNTSAYIGNNSSSTGEVTVTGSGSTWTNSSSLYVGIFGSGTLFIADGGHVSNTNAFIGWGSNSTAQVTGSGSTWTNSQSLNVGGLDTAAGGSGVLTIGPGGLVHVGETLNIWNGGTVNLYGGSLRFDEYQRESGGTMNYLAGKVQMAGDRIFGLDTAVTEFFGAAPLISAGKHLHVEGTATLFAPTTLSGGTLTVSNLLNPSLLSFNTGTFNLTGANLYIGDGGMFGDTLAAGNQQTYNISQTATVGYDGVLSVANGGRFEAQTLVNHGDVFLGGNNARIKTSPVTTFHNYGSVSGAGRIEGDFINHAGGIVELEAGKRLVFSDYFTNQTDGRVIGRGQMVAPAIGNWGQMLFSGGFTDLQAPIIGYDGSQLIVTGGSTTTVFGDVEIQGGAELRISDFSNAVFFDHVQLRNGALLTGGGNAFFEGSLGIGDSPGRHEFTFNVTLGPSSNLLVEIAGTNPLLPEFDQYIFLQDLTLQGGALSIDLIGLNPSDLPYVPQLGDTFSIFDVHGTWSGQFGSYHLPTLNGGLEWNLSQLYSHGTIFISQAIPEPSSGIGLSIVILGLLAGRRRK
ncbi:MAG TPA: PEP-CTERM sorting domain-containing protein [Pirellulaceae bacterium]|nr:PEP-CTERM sorting domain-containing protein [Pirellulaceae bacterium]